jgi:hypothetical protein
VLRRSVRAFLVPRPKPRRRDSGLPPCPCGRPPASVRRVSAASAMVKEERGGVDGSYTGGEGGGGGLCAQGLRGPVLVLGCRDRKPPLVSFAECQGRGAGGGGILSTHSSLRLGLTTSPRSLSFCAHGPPWAGLAFTLHYLLPQNRPKYDGDTANAIAMAHHTQERPLPYSLLPAWCGFYDVDGLLAPSYCKMTGTFRCINSISLLLLEGRTGCD